MQRIKSGFCPVLAVTAVFCTAAQPVPGIIETNYSISIANYEMAPADPQEPVLLYFGRMFNADFTVLNFDNQYFHEQLNIRIASGTVPDFWYLRTATTFPVWELLVEGGVLFGLSSSAFGTSDVRITAGTLEIDADSTLTITGWLTGTSSGTLKLDVSGSNSSILSVTGKAEFAGSLNLNFAAMPAAGRICFSICYNGEPERTVPRFVAIQQKTNIFLPETFS
jgi:hypothetical protein